MRLALLLGLVAASIGSVAAAEEHRRAYTDIEQLKEEIRQRREGQEGFAVPAGPGRTYYTGSAGFRPQMWADMVGMEGEEAAAKIREERPDLKQVIVVPYNSPMTMDMRMDRVRVVVDSTGKVVQPPRIG